MATDKLRFAVSRHFDIVTPRSAAIGDAEYRDSEFIDRPMSLEDVVRELRDCEALSTGPVRSPDDLSEHDWASTEPSEDYRSGHVRTDSVHIRGIGRPMTSANLYRIYRLAGLVGR